MRAVGIAPAQVSISLGHKLNLNVIAEGVETEAQLAFLREHHCDEFQGFLISEPVRGDGGTTGVPAAEFREMLARGPKPVVATGTT